MNTVSFRKTISSVFLLIALLCSQKMMAQLCDPNTPFYTCNLTGNPNGTWQSPSNNRVGLCCSAVSPDVCVEILVTLDSEATGISFNIASGAVPPGALYYQIDCGVPTAVGQPICLNGPGPYHLTFCKPGNNPNSYSINSFGPPTIAVNVSNVVSPQCTATLAVQGTQYSESSIIWSSVPMNAQYNSFLSCTTGCDTVTITPSGNLPPYVDYKVCGLGSDPCNTAYVCDTVRVYFYNALQLTVSPNQTLCNGVTSTSITSNVTGGSGTYQYLWSNGNTTSSFTAGAGTFTLTVSDPMICTSKSASTTVTVVPPIASNAGGDVLVCKDQPQVSLDGSIQTSTSAVWTGGTGTFVPNNTTLNATYTPSAFEIASGQAQLILQTTSNMGCPGASDTVQITIANVPVPVINGTTSVCSNLSNTYTAPSSPGTTYLWTVNGGIINGANNTNTLNVLWGSGTSGTVSLTMTNSFGCSATVNSNITISQPISALAGNDINICANQNSVQLNGNVQNATSFVWTGGTGTFNPGNTSLNPTYYPSAFEIANGSAQLILQTSPNQGCAAASDTILVTIAPMPNATLSGSTNICANVPASYSAPFQAGMTYSWTVNGGIIIGPSNTNAINVSWGTGNSGSVSVTVTNAAGCSTSSNAAITISQPITAVAGNDLLICANQTNVPLNGNVQNATGYSWTGCSGTFTPNNTVLNPTYHPSASEIANGFAQLILQTPPNQGCAAASDTILIAIAPMPNATLNGSTTICANQPISYTVPNQAGVTYSWTVTGGTIIGPINSNSINVNWGTGNSGSVSVTVTNAAGCSTSSNATINVSQPISAAAGNDILICANQTSVQLGGSVQNASAFSWTGGSGTFSPGNNVLNPTYFPSASEVSNGFAQLILLTAPNQGCAAVNDTILITISPMPNAALTGSTNICSNMPVSYSAPFQAGMTYSWTVNGGTIIGPSNTNTINVNWGLGNAGNVSLTVTNSAGCSTSSNAVISISQPITAAAGNDLLICANQSSVQLSGSTQNATGYMWTGGSGTFNPGNNVLNPTYFPSASEVANGFVQLILQTPPNQGCASASDTILVTIAPMPDATVTGSTNICANQPFNYSVPFALGTTYNWNVSGGTMIGPSNTNSISVDWGTGNSGSINLTVTTTSGCSASANTLISVSQPITAVAGNDIMICANQNSVQLNGNVQNSTAFTWIGGGGSFNPGNTVLNATYTPSSSEIASGTAQLILQTPPNQGCAAASDTILVTIAPMPDATLSGSTTICASLPIIYSVPNQVGTTYSWNVTGGLINGPSNTSSLNVSWGTGTTGTIQLTATNAAGCSTSANATINISQPVQATAGNDITICESETMITLNGSIQNTSGFLWTGGNGFFNPGNNVLNPSYTPSASEIANGFVNLVLQTSPNQSCPGAGDTVHVTINQDPDPTVTGNQVACANSNGSFTSPLQAGYAYDWSVIGGNIQGSSNSNSISTLWGNTGPCSVTLTITNAAGCSSTATQNISLVVLPNPIVSGDNTPCQLSTSNYSVNPTQGSTYTWTVLNGTITGGSTGNNINVNWLNPGGGTVSVTETNSLGCSQSASFEATVSELSIPSITGSNTVCTGTASTTYTTPLVSNTTYSWMVNGGTILSGNGSNTINVQWNTQGTNSVVVTATNATGCDSTITFIVDVNTVNPISVVSTGLSGCPPLTVTFVGNQPSPGQTYQWSFGDQEISSSPNPTHTFTETGTYQVSVLTQNGPGCDDAAQTTVQVFEEPEAGFNHNYEGQTYYVGESELQITNTTYHGVSYNWDLGDNRSSQAFEPEKVYTEQGDFLITLISLSAEGCPDTAVKEIHVKFNEMMYLPTAFTPNGDGTNDNFSMLFTNIKDITVNIFNRWGQVIFTSHDPNFQWDGTYWGHYVENGVYVYRIEAVGESGKGYVQIGSVTVVR